MDRRSSCCRWARPEDAAAIADRAPAFPPAPCRHLHRRSQRTPRRDSGWLEVMLPQQEVWVAEASRGGGRLRRTARGLAGAPLADMAPEQPGARAGPRLCWTSPWRCQLGAGLQVVRPSGIDRAPALLRAARLRGELVCATAQRMRKASQTCAIAGRARRGEQGRRRAPREADPLNQSAVPPRCPDLGDALACAGVYNYLQSGLGSLLPSELLWHGG